MRTLKQINNDKIPERAYSGGSHRNIEYDKLAVKICSLPAGRSIPVEFDTKSKCLSAMQSVLNRDHRIRAARRGLVVYFSFDSEATDGGK